MDSCGRGVAPYAGAWIEIGKLERQSVQLLVAPYAGAWIEMLTLVLLLVLLLVSLPTRERGLK